MPGLEVLLKPIKWADKQVLREYTKIGKKLKLDERNRKYWTGWALNILSIPLSGPPARALAGSAFDWGTFAVLQCVDAAYNWRGIFGGVKEDNASDVKTLDGISEFYKNYNSIFRFPTLIAGIGLVGKYGLGLFSNLAHGTPTDPDDWNYLQYGASLLSVASSMYIKEIDPKLLKRKPFWKEAYNFIKEKISSLSQELAPRPAPAYNLNLNKK